MKRKSILPRSILDDWMVSQNHSQTYLEPTNDGWGTHEATQYLLSIAATNRTFDFNTALGDTIKEKYESFCFALYKLNDSLVQYGARGAFWIVTSKDIAIMFYNNPSGWTPAKKINQRIEIAYIGCINNKWQIFIDNKMKPHQLLMGVNTTRQVPTHYGAMNVLNFIF